MPIIPNVKIVVVEPDQIVRDFIVDVLEFSVNREVTAFDNGLKALRHIDAGTTDFVMAEADLPGIAGEEFFKKIKSRWPQMVCVMMSSRPESAAAAAALGLEAYVAKPVGVQSLFAIVENFIAAPNPERASSSEG